MLVENKQALVKFSKKHTGSRISMGEWSEKAEASRWTNFADVRCTFNSADCVKPFVLFNIAGNKYRVVTEIVYKRGKVRIAKVGTHEEYSRWKL